MKSFKYSLFLGAATALMYSSSLAAAAEVLSDTVPVQVDASNPLAVIDPNLSPAATGKKAKKVRNKKQVSAPLSVEQPVQLTAEQPQPMQTTTEQPMTVSEAPVVPVTTALTTDATAQLQATAPVTDPVVPVSVTTQPEAMVTPLPVQTTAPVGIDPSAQLQTAPNLTDATAIVSPPVVATIPTPTVDTSAQLQATAPVTVSVNPVVPVIQPEATITPLPIQTAAPVGIDPSAQLQVAPNLTDATTIVSPPVVATIPTPTVDATAQLQAAASNVIEPTTTLENAPPPSDDAKARAEAAIAKLMGESAPSVVASDGTTAQAEDTTSAVSLAPVEEAAETVAPMPSEESVAPVVATKKTKKPKAKLTPEQIAERVAKGKAKLATKKKKTSEEIDALKAAGQTKSDERKAAKVAKAEDTQEEVVSPQLPESGAAESPAVTEAQVSSTNGDASERTDASTADHTTSTSTPAPVEEPKPTYAVIVMNKTPNGSEAISISATEDHAFNKANMPKQPEKVIDSPPIQAPETTPAPQSNIVSGSGEASHEATTAAGTEPVQHTEGTSSEASAVTGGQHEGATSKDEPIKETEPLIVSAKDGKPIDVSHDKDGVVEPVVPTEERVAAEEHSTAVPAA